MKTAAKLLLVKKGDEEFSVALDKFCIGIIFISGPNKSASLKTTSYFKPIVSILIY